MCVLDRHDAGNASWKLRRKLGRANPGVFIWGGISISEPHKLLVRCSEEIDVPSEFMYQGNMYPVDFLVRSPKLLPRETYATEATTSPIHQDQPGSEATNKGERGSSGLRHLCGPNTDPVVSETNTGVDGSQDRST
jgi:hypothetical protein